MESLLTILVIVLLSAASNWIAKRRQGEDESWGDDPKPPSPGQPSQKSDPKQTTRRDWEDELRRLFEGERSPRPEARGPERESQPPAVPAQEQRRMHRQAPPPLPKKPSRTPERTVTPRRVEHSPAEAAKKAAESFKRAQRQVAERAQKVPTPEAGGVSPAEKKAQQLREQVAQRAQRIALAERESRKLGLEHRRGDRKEPSKEIQAAIALVRDESKVRQAFIASLVFGPPKADEG